MKNRLVFRILGALSSALIIVSVFIPFVSVTGYSQSLWQSNTVLKTLYLPIMIIVFGAIGVLAFAINVKTELAYASSGALLFYLITQTIPVINQKLFNTFGVGYYCLVVGTILTGVMAFICNLRVKKKNVETDKVQETTLEQVSVIDQIDKLYNDQTPTSSLAEEEIIQPISFQSLPIEPIQQLQPLQSLQPLESVQNTMEPSVQSIESNIGFQDDLSINNSIESNVNMELSAPKIEVKQEENSSNLNEITSNFNVNLEDINKPTSSSNPVMAEFGVSELTNESVLAPSNPVTAEFATPDEPVSTSSNLVTAEFGESKPTNEPVLDSMNPVTAEFGISGMPEMSIAQTQEVVPNVQSMNNNGPAPINPVTAQFDATPTMTILPQIEGNKVETQPIQPLANENTIQPLGTTAPSVDVMADQPTNTSSNLDIFG